MSHQIANPPKAANISASRTVVRTAALFAYDLNEPDVVKILLTLAEQGRVRIILDNASLHVTKKAAKVKTPEDQFTALFQQRQKGRSSILRGSFARYSHDKIFIVSRNWGNAIQVPSPHPPVSTDELRRAVSMVS